MEESLLTVKNLSAWYDSEKKVLRDFNLELKGHEAAGLIGLNGAGKTTFLKVLSGLLPTFSAEQIRFQGKDVNLRDEAFKACRGQFVPVFYILGVCSLCLFCLRKEAAGSVRAHKGISL